MFKKFLKIAVISTFSTLLRSQMFYMFHYKLRTVTKPTTGSVFTSSVSSMSWSVS